MMKNFMLLIGGLFLLVLAGCGSKQESYSSVEDNDYETWSCEDRTSYDRNWNNDMYCTSSKGRERYTSYEGARQLEAL